MSFRPIKSFQRYLSLDLNVCTEICPDWLLVFFEFLRQQIQGLAPGDAIEIRKPVWDAAGVITLDRRKKVMDHLARSLPNDVVSFKRQRGKAPNTIVGTKMAAFHSKSGPPATTKLIPNNVSGVILNPVTQGAEFKG
jgi:hypothetical protein